MAEAIHSWNYIQDRKYASKIELFHDHILQHQGQAHKEPIRYSFEEFFLMDTILGNPIVDFELLEYVITISVIEEFSPEAQQVYSFYQDFDNKQLVEGSYEHETNSENTVRYFRTINKYGLEQYYENELGIYIESRQRFDRFFFQGPLMAHIPLDLRKRWQRSVWAASGGNSSYKLEEGFPLFDYSKIVPKRYEGKDSEQEVRESLEIKNGCILITKEEKDATISHKYSIEQIWYDERLIPEAFSDYLHEIHDNLAGGIVEGKRTRKYRRSAATTSFQDPTQCPGEAPPA